MTGSVPVNFSSLLKLQCSSETDNKQLQISSGKGVSDERKWPFRELKVR